MSRESLPLLLLALSLVACKPDNGPKADAPDADGDGSPDSEDCAPDDVYAYPGAAERCNGQDDNCDGQVDEGVSQTFYLDDDGDGFGSNEGVFLSCEMPEGASVVGGDCDDDDRNIRPGVVETCDGVDQDCNGLIDDDAGTLWYVDADHDGFGVEDDRVRACALTAGLSDEAGDCDDEDPTSYPGGVETCDERDNDCDGWVDEAVQDVWYRDSDRDGYGRTVDSFWGCSRPTGYVDVGGDCADADAAIHPDAEELCDGVDNDCDSITDELIEGSLHFDGSDDFAYIGDCAGVDITGYGPVTFEAWIYTENNMADAAVLAKEGSGQPQYWFGQYRSTFGMLLSSGSSWGLDARQTPTLVGYRWTHIASVWDGSSWYNYLDGETPSSRGSGSYSSSIPDTSHPLTIGSNSSLDSTKFRGNIADIRLYGVARTQSQIQENMYELRDTTGLVARWILDEGSGDWAYDSVGSCHARLGSTEGSDTRDPAWSTEVPVCEID